MYIKKELLEILKIHLMDNKRDLEDGNLRNKDGQKLNRDCVILDETNDLLNRIFKFNLFQQFH